MQLLYLGQAWVASGGIEGKVVGPEDDMVTDLIPQDGSISAVAAFHPKTHLYLVQKSTWKLLLATFAYLKTIMIAKRFSRFFKYLKNWEDKWYDDKPGERVSPSFIQIDQVGRQKNEFLDTRRSDIWEWKKRKEIEDY